MAKRGTTSKIAKRFVSKSKSVSPSKKKAKASSAAVFGTSSQFRGIGRGVPGDARK